MSTVRFTRQMTVDQFDKLFPDENACKAYLVARRWPDGVRCPRCGNEKVWELKARPFHWLCRNCSDQGYRFSVLVGTVMQNTNIPVRTWFKAIYFMLVSEKGISALQLHLMLGFGSYETALYLCNRIRAGLLDPNFGKLMGIVEVDETFVGGKNKNRHWDKKTDGTGGAGKAIVAGAVSRKGNVVARVSHNTDTRTMQTFVREAVSTKVDLLATTNIAPTKAWSTTRIISCGTGAANTWSVRSTFRRLIASGR